MLDSELQHLLIQSQGGDKDAYREFLGYLSTYLPKVLRRKIGLNDYNDDIAQEVLLAVHKNLATYNGSAPIKAWIHGILRFKVADYFRKVGRDQEKLNLFVEDEELDNEASQASAENVEAQYESKTFVHSFLSELPSCTKNAVLLTKVEGRSMKEASEILGVKEVNLRKQLSRAMKMLHKRFEFYE